MRRKHKGLEIPECTHLSFRYDCDFDEVSTYVLKRSLWDYFVDFNKRRKSIFLFHNDFMFNNSISTDGYTVSVHLAHKTIVGKDRIQRKQICKELTDNGDAPYLDSLPVEELESIIKNNIHVFCDPGKKNIVYMSDGKKKNEGGTHFRYAYVQRRYECAFKQNQRGLMHKKRETQTNKKRTVQEAEEAITYNSKSCHLNEVKKFIIQYRELQNELTDFYESEYHRKCRYRSYVRKQRSEMRLLDKIDKLYKKDGKEIAIIIGDWSTSHHLKGFAPTIGMRRLLRKRFPVYLLNEWGTSKRCHHCHHDTDYVKTRTYDAKDGPKTKAVHGLLGCTNPECSKLWNRDVNAVANQSMLVKCIFEKKERPSAFRPSTNQSTSSGKTSNIITVIANSQA